VADKVDHSQGITTDRTSQPSGIRALDMTRILIRLTKLTVSSQTDFRNSIR